MNKQNIQQLLSLDKQLLIQSDLDKLLHNLKDISKKSDNIAKFAALINNRIFSDINYLIIKNIDPMQHLLDAIQNANTLSYNDKFSIIHLLLAFYDYQIVYSQFWPVDKHILFDQQIMEKLHESYLKIRSMVNKKQYAILYTKPIKINTNDNHSDDKDDWTTKGEYIT